jgi:hypothetical protein
VLDIRLGAIFTSSHFSLLSKVLDIRLGAIFTSSHFSLLSKVLDIRLGAIFTSFGWFDSIESSIATTI